VDTDNHNRALALYESCGFRVATRSATYRKPFEPGEDSR
jgi:ribosomal protein S18 acetylase RimI-like enzyme